MWGCAAIALEWLWYIVASIGAGVGTGLVGLSAATVMVPILIVLCPSFGGETGAYQATAIALASDVLGSAVTTYTYAKHRNIDLKRGWLMFVCVVGMCTVGSYAAFAVGNVVLGSFTLFLTFFIGIRFLVKPDTGGEGRVAKGERLDGRGVFFSLFFGLPVGFGAGFVGTGGGMIMLIVFTVFLGMELKCAVGTSTFIMTFTALVASVAHVLIHPVIVFEKWPVLVLCIVVTTVASLVSARFANRAQNRTVGLATGIVLTALGAAMLVLSYWDVLEGFPLVHQTRYCLGALAAYIAPCLAVLLPIRFLTKLPSYVFRKLLHVVAFTCVSLMILAARSWQAAVLASVVIAILVYPILVMLEREPWYSGLFVEKSPGEIKRSMLMLFLMFAALIGVCWGVFGQPHLCATAILMWGTGDAAAAVVGIPFGRHKVRSRLTDGKKSWEGSAAMLVVSFACGLVMLLLVQKATFSQAVVSAFVAALLGTATELVSASEYDTVTVPAVIAAVLLTLCPLCV